VIGTMRALGNTSRIELPSTYALTASEFMKNNHKSFTKELSEWKTELEHRGTLRRVVDKTTNFVISDLGFAWIRGMNTATNNIVWLGAESKARAMGMDPKEAIGFADDTVRDTQGSGLPTDKTLFESTVAGEMLTMYWTFFSRTYNLNREIKGKTRSAKDLPRAAYHYGMMIGMAALMASVVKGALGKDPEKDLAPGQLTLDEMSFLMNMAPVLREFTGVLNGYDYRGPAGFTAIVKLYKAYAAIEKAMKGLE
jgi:hypothetical protein